MRLPIAAETLTLDASLKRVIKRVKISRDWGKKLAIVYGVLCFEVMFANLREPRFEYMQPAISFQAIANSVVSDLLTGILSPGGLCLSGFGRCFDVRGRMTDRWRRVGVIPTTTPTSGDAYHSSFSTSATLLSIRHR